MINPVISIILPVYNVEPYLRRCLDSVIVQTYVNFEAILVDDGSTDNSGVICDEYASKDNRFVVIHKKNEGVAKARLTAFERSKGELITFIDSDDFVSLDYLEKLSKPILESDADMVSCDYYKVEGSRLLSPLPKLTGLWEDDILRDFVANHYFYDEKTHNFGMTQFLWTKMIKRGFVYEGLKHGEGMWYAEDQIGVFQMLLCCNKLALIGDRLYFYVQHEGQAMKKYNYSLWENLVILMEKYQALDKDNLAKVGRKKRFFLQIEFTIIGKMIPSGINRKTFVSHISKLRSHPFMISFFQPAMLGFGLRNELFYQLLKMKFYKILYFLSKKTNI